MRSGTCSLYKEQVLRRSPAYLYFAPVPLQTFSAINNLSLQYPMCINSTLGSTRKDVNYQWNHEMNSLLFSLALA